MAWILEAELRRPLVSHVPRHREEHDDDNKNNPDVEGASLGNLARRRHTRK